MNSWGGEGELKIETLLEGFWRIVCSSNCREAGGRIRGVALATRKNESPLQVIEKKKLKSVLKLTLAGRFCDRQAFGRNRKLLGNWAPPLATTADTSVAKVASK
jgi:hypothetical protein